MTPASKNAPQANSNVVFYPTVSLACHNYCAHLPQKHSCVQPGLLGGGWSIVNNPASFAAPAYGRETQQAIERLSWQPHKKLQQTGALGDPSNTRMASKDVWTWVSQLTSGLS